MGIGLAIDRLADDIPNAAEGLVADGHLDGGAGIDDLGITLQAIRTGHGDRTNHVALEVHLDLEHGGNVTDWSIGIHRERVVDRRDGISRKLAVYDSTNDANDASNVLHSCVLIITRHSLILQSGSATDDFGNLSGDGTLAHAVVQTIQRLDHLGRVVGRGLHRLAASALLGSG